jgi:eukaryotic-like serine/threonine-protein kinase
MKKLTWQKFGMTLGIGFGIVFLSAFITSQIIFPIIFGRPRNVQVPDLVGSQFSTARRTLVKLGLHAVVRDSVWSETYKIDTILEQDPKAGKRIKPESTIYFRISRGSKQVEVPSLTGLSYHEAYFVIHNLGLKCSVTDSLFSQRYAANTVLSSTPTAGANIEKGSRIRLKISRGPDPALTKADSISTVNKNQNDIW